MELDVGLEEGCNEGEGPATAMPTINPKQQQAQAQVALTSQKAALVQYLLLFCGISGKYLLHQNGLLFEAEVDIGYKI